MNVSGKKIGLGVFALAVGLMGSVAVADMAKVLPLIWENLQPACAEVAPMARVARAMAVIFMRFIFRSPLYGIQAG